MILKNPLFLVSCFLFWVNQSIERSGYVIPFVHAYADDLLAMPVVLGLTLQAMRWIYPKGNSLVFSKVQVMVGWAYFSVLLEVVLPRIVNYFSADIWDVLCYGLGSVAFWFWMNKPETMTRKESNRQGAQAG